MCEIFQHFFLKENMLKFTMNFDLENHINQTKVLKGCRFHLISWGDSQVIHMFYLLKFMASRLYSELTQMQRPPGRGVFNTYKHRIEPLPSPELSSLELMSVLTYYSDKTVLL
jgi:hypothetical protein